MKVDLIISQSRSSFHLRSHLVRLRDIAPPNFPPSIHTTQPGRKIRGSSRRASPCSQRNSRLQHTRTSSRGWCCGLGLRVYLASILLASYINRDRTFINKVLNFTGVGLALYIVASFYEWVSSDSIIKATVKCKYCRKRISEKVSACYELTILFNVCVGETLCQLYQLVRWQRRSRLRIETFLVIRSWYGYGIELDFQCSSSRYICWVSP